MKDRSIGVWCMSHNCLLCCQHTNMYLTHADIQRIISLGYSPSFFCIENQGWIQLKNHHDRCVFHDGTKCTIYQNRPEGCRLYPIVYDDDIHQAVVDDDCPLHDTMVISKKKHQQLVSLIRILKYEQHQRNSGKCDVV